MGDGRVIPTPVAVTLRNLQNLQDLQEQGDG